MSFLAAVHNAQPMDTGMRTNLKREGRAWQTSRHRKNLSTQPRLIGTTRAFGRSAENNLYFHTNVCHENSLLRFFQGLDQEVLLVEVEGTPSACRNMTGAQDVALYRPLLEAFFNRIIRANHDDWEFENLVVEQ